MEETLCAGCCSEGWHRCSSWSGGTAAPSLWCWRRQQERRGERASCSRGAEGTAGWVWKRGAVGARSSREMGQEAGTAPLLMAFSCFLGSLDSWMAWAGPGCSAVEPPQHSQPPQHLSFGRAACCGLPGSCNSAFSSHSLPISSPFSPSLIIHSLICCLSPHAPLAICHCG